MKLLNLTGAVVALQTVTASAAETTTTTTAPTTLMTTTTSSSSSSAIPKETHPVGRKPWNPWLVWPSSITIPGASSTSTSTATSSMTSSTRPAYGWLHPVVSGLIQTTTSSSSVSSASTSSAISSATTSTTSGGAILSRAEPAAPTTTIPSMRYCDEIMTLKPYIVNGPAPAEASTLSKPEDLGLSDIFNGMSMYTLGELMRFCVARASAATSPTSTTIIVPTGPAIIISSYPAGLAIGLVSSTTLTSTSTQALETQTLDKRQEDPVEPEMQLPDPSEPSTSPKPNKRQEDPVEPEMQEPDPSETPTSERRMFNPLVKPLDPVVVSFMHPHPHPHSTSSSTSSATSTATESVGSAAPHGVTIGILVDHSTTLFAMQKSSSSASASSTATTTTA